MCRMSYGTSILFTTTIQWKAIVCDKKNAVHIFLQQKQSYNITNNMCVYSLEESIFFLFVLNAHVSILQKFHFISRLTSVKLQQNFAQSSYKCFFMWFVHSHSLHYCYFILLSSLCSRCACEAYIHILLVSVGLVWNERESSVKVFEENILLLGQLYIKCYTQCTWVCVCWCSDNIHVKLDLSGCLRFWWRAAAAAAWQILLRLCITSGVFLFFASIID